MLLPEAATPSPSPNGGPNPTLRSSPRFPGAKMQPAEGQNSLWKKAGDCTADPVARPGLLALLVHVPAISIHQTAPAILGEVFGYNGNSASFVDVIRVQPTKEISTSFGKSLIDSLRLTLICFTDPIGNPLFVLAQDCYSLVCATSIDHDVFEIRISLQQNRTDRFLDKRP